MDRPEAGGLIHDRADEQPEKRRRQKGQGVVEIDQIRCVGDEEISQVQIIEKYTSQFDESDRDKKQGEERLAAPPDFGRKEIHGKYETLEDNERMENALEVGQEGHHRIGLASEFAEKFCSRLCIPGNFIRNSRERKGGTATKLQFSGIRPLASFPPLDWEKISG